ncbi:MAG: hypothetical protein HOY71_26035 [Nonomuraea sp.]|nr:hypothetical protein [Nonomuraea sp.]
MDTNDDVLPLQPPVHLPPEPELTAAALATGLVQDGGDVLESWAALARERLEPGGPAFLTLARLFLAREPLTVAEPEPLAELGLLAGGGPYELTGLGLWTARLLVSDASGQDIPVYGALAGADAAALLHGLRGYHADEREQELAGWLETHEPAEIAAVLTEVSPLSRAVGIDVLAEIAKDQLDELVHEPRLGAVIAARLGRDDRQPAPEEFAWVLVDMAAAMLEFGGGVEDVLRSLDTGELAGTLTMLTLCEHPWTATVLGVFATHHSDPQVSATARKALRRLHRLAR